MSEHPRGYTGRSADACRVRELLLLRRQLKSRLCDCDQGWDEEWAISLEITRVSRRMKKEKQKKVDAEDEGAQEQGGVAAGSSSEQNGHGQAGQVAEDCQPEGGSDAMGG